MTMELVVKPEGFRIEAKGADPEKVRIIFCDSCHLNTCTQMLSEGFARVGVPREKRDESEADKTRFIETNAKCLKG